MHPTFTTIQEARRWASVFLQQHQREPRVGDLLLEHFLQLSFSQLLAYERDPFPEQQRDSFIDSVKQHAETGIPVQHLIGRAHFYGREFKVNGHVLIPRPETEELVVGVLEWLSKSSLRLPKIVDIGTGSGVIAITLALECKEADVSAVDLSSVALKVAEENDDIYDAGVHFLQGSFLDPVDGEVDILVSNPPYISYEEKDSMDDTVVNFDPEMALFAKDNGLSAYHSIIQQVKEKQLSPSLIAFEIGYQQGEEVKAIVEQYLPEYEAVIRQDINQKDRMVFAEKRV